MKEFYFIRHGQTDCNKYDDGLCYLDDFPLNKKGLNQAKRTGEYLKKFRMKDKPFDCIISSPRTRANQTANIIADQINFIGSKGNEVIKVEELKELSKGSIDKYYEVQYKILEKIVDPIQHWEIENGIDQIIEEKYKIKEMDRVEDVENRVIKIINMLKNMKEDKVIIVSHYGFLFCTLIPKMFGIPPMSIQHFTGQTPIEENCAICYVKYYEDIDRFEMVMPPSTEHLKI